MEKRAALTGLIVGFALGGAGESFAPFIASQLLSSDQPYAGQQQRQISSLSETDISALKKGEGWGLAKPAELNGYPGPAHVLELSGKLSLSDEQIERVEAAFTEMKAKAIGLGDSLVEAEAALDEAFKLSLIDEDVLNERIAAAEEIRAALRTVHLAAHLKVTPLLSSEQKRKYAMLRGYGDRHNGHSGH